MKKILSLLLICFFAGTSALMAQNWGGGVDDEDFNFGYSFQYISTEYKIWKNVNWKAPVFDESGTLHQLSAISSKPTSGFAIGFVANRKITGNLDLRGTPSLAFTERSLEYSYSPNTGPDLTPAKIISQKVQGTMVEIPVSLKLKSDRLKNFRGYMLGGIKYSADLSSRKKTDNTTIGPELDKKINNQRMFLSYEGGAGMDFYFGFFKLSTELKVSQSFKDVFVHENTIYANPIEKAKLRHFTFSLFFE